MISMEKSGKHGVIDTLIELSVFSELISPLAYSAPGAGMAEISVMIVAFDMFS